MLVCLVDHCLWCERCGTSFADTPLPFLVLVQSFPYSFIVRCVYRLSFSVMLHCSPRLSSNVQDVQGTRRRRRHGSLDRRSSRSIHLATHDHRYACHNLSRYYCNVNTISDRSTHHEYQRTYHVIYPSHAINVPERGASASISPVLLNNSPSSRIHARSPGPSDVILTRQGQIILPRDSEYPAPTNTPSPSLPHARRIRHALP